MEVREYFNLRELPFTREVEAGSRIAIDSLDAIASDLQKTLENRLSAAIIGVAGGGKTSLIRGLQEKLSPARFRLVYLKLSALNSRELCRSLSVGLGFEPRASLALFIRSFDAHIKNLSGDQKVHPIIIFDDAQDLRPETLKIIRALTNFEMDSRLLTSVLLVGQPPLKTRLLQNEFEDIRHRLSFTREIPLLTLQETQYYLNERVKIAGGLKDKSVFSKESVSTIFEKTHGNMRAIDKLALKSMEVCAKERTSDIVTGAQVFQGAEEVWM